MSIDQSARFWDRIAKRYARKPVADEVAYQEKLRVTREYLRPHMKVLEFGCGTGSTAIAHAPHVKHILAIDISANMIDIARRRAGEAEVDNVTFERAAIDEYDVPDQTLDVVMGHSILHLLGNREAVIARAYDMLKPGGVLITSTPCLGDTMKYFRLIVPIGKALGLMPMVKVFSASDLHDSMTDAGFEIDYQWRPGKGQAVFMVAKKTE